MGGFSKYVNEQKCISKVNAVFARLYITKKETKKNLSGVILIKICRIKRCHPLLPNSIHKCLAQKWLWLSGRLKIYFSS